MLAASPRSFSGGKAARHPQPRGELGAGDLERPVRRPSLRLPARVATASEPVKGAPAGRPTAGPAGPPLTEPKASAEQSLRSRSRLLAAKHRPTTMIRTPPPNPPSRGRTTLRAPCPSPRRLDRGAGQVRRPTPPSRRSGAAPLAICPDPPAAADKNHRMARPATGQVVVRDRAERRASVPGFGAHGQRRSLIVRRSQADSD